MIDLATIPALDTIPEIKEVIRATFTKLGCPVDFERLKVEFNDLFSARLGDASTTLLRIRFSSSLWPRADKTQRYKTIVHEACHIIARLLYGSFIKPHGREWKMLMRRMGIEPERCHDLDTQGVKNKKAKFETFCKCPDPLHLVTRKVFERIDLGTVRYTCRKCKARLTSQKQD